MLNELFIQRWKMLRRLPPPISLLKAVWIRHLLEGRRRRGGLVEQMAVGQVLVAQGGRGAVEHALAAGHDQLCGGGLGEEGNWT